MDSETTTKTSKYNEAGFNILRLHNSWLRCAQYRSNANLDKWKWELDNVWSDLVQDVTKEKLGNEYTIVLQKNSALKKIVAQYYDDKNKLYLALDARHNFLRQLQDRVGKGGVYDDGTGEDFE